MDGPRLRRILHYLKPHRRIVLMGAVSLVVVNLLGVSLPLIVRNAVDALHGGFALSDVLQKAGLIIALATVMGLVVAGDGSSIVPAAVVHGPLSIATGESASGA